jgi:hypothetical protein
MSHRQNALAVMRHGLMAAAMLLALATMVPGQYLTEAFSTAAMPPPGGVVSYFSLAADFNQNGYADIAYFPYLSPYFLVDLDPAVSGVAPYTQQAYFTGGMLGGPTQGAAIDVNGDGLLDLALVHSSAALSIHIGNGNGTFVTAGGLMPNIVGWWSAMADVNNDGLPDVLTAAGSGGSSLWAVECHLNQPPNWPSAWFMPIINGAVDMGGGGPRVGDFDGDGNIDIAITWGVGTVMPQVTNVLWGNGVGQFTALSATSTPGLPTTYGHKTVGAADMNGDGITDLIRSAPTGIGGVTSELMQVYLGSPTRTMILAGSFVVPPTGPRPMATFAADFNRDGFGDLLRAPNFSSDPSLVTACNINNTLTMALGLPGGQFHQSGMTTTPTPFSGPAYCPSSVVADFDGDGDLDLALTPRNTPFYFFRNRALNGAGCVGSGTAPSSLRPSNAQVGNLSFDATISGTFSNAPAVLAIATGLNSSPFNSCGVYLDLAGPVVYLPGTTDVFGRCVWPLPIPANPALHGAVANAQAAVLDPLGPSFGGVYLSLTPARTVIIW